MPSLLKTGIKYGAIFGVAKTVSDGYSKSKQNSTPNGQYSSGPLQSEYAHESWCNGSCGDRCRSRSHKQQQQQQAPQAQQYQQYQQYQPHFEQQRDQYGPSYSYIHQAGCKGDCNLRCCDGMIAGRQWEANGPPVYQH